MLHPTPGVGQSGPSAGGVRSARAQLPLLEGCASCARSCSPQCPLFPLLPLGETSIPDSGNSFRVGQSLIDCLLCLSLLSPPGVLTCARRASHSCSVWSCSLWALIYFFFQMGICPLASATFATCLCSTYCLHGPELLSMFCDLQLGSLFRTRESAVPELGLLAGADQWGC